MLADSYVLLFWILSANFAQSLKASAWHLNRRRAILAKYPDLLDKVTADLKEGGDKRTLPSLIAVNSLQLAIALQVGAEHHQTFNTLQTCLLGATVGGTLSLWQFSLLHDIKHGGASLFPGISPNLALFIGSQPSVFGYFLYLRFGHLSHHKDFGSKSLKDSFDSTAVNFEDGDVLFNAHRQMLAGDVKNETVGFFGNEQVGGRGLSISRSFYSLFWREEAPMSNLLVYTVSMSYERAALCVNDIIVAITGTNLFFPSKPKVFLDTNARYSRMAALLHAMLLLVAGPQALLYLFVSELAWQLPVHPAFAMFVSNHPSYSTTTPDGRGVCQPTSSVYMHHPSIAVRSLFDLTCAFTNYHVEHHDFPEVPLWNLRQIREEASEFYDCLEGAEDSWTAVVRKAFRGRQFYGCEGEL